MKLLFVIPEYLPDCGGGIITFYKFILPQLVRQGHGVQVIVADARHVGAAERVIDGVTVSYLRREVHGRWLAAFARYEVIFPWLHQNLALAWSAWEVAQGGDGYEHVETTEWPLLFVPWVVNRQRAPCTVQLHGSHGQIMDRGAGGTSEICDGFVRMIEAALMKEAVAVQTNSQLNARVWAERLGRTVSVENPSFQLDPRGAVAAATLGRPLRGLVFGRLYPGKGAVALAEALAGPASGMTTIEWYGNDMTCGGGLTSNVLRARFPAVLDRALRHFPQITHDEVLAKMTGGAFVLIPSLSDVFNLTVAEAMAMRAIVVCSVYAGAIELIEHGVNGFRYDPLDAKSLASVLAEMSALTADQVTAMAERAAQTVANRLDPARSAERRAKFYAEVAALPLPAPIPDWLTEAVSGSAIAPDMREVLDRCGASELSAALLRRAPRFLSKS